MPAASVATSVTSARPIISADAVDAVRCGFRRELSRASTPAAPPSRMAGQPRIPESTGMAGADSMATPTKTISVPPIRSRSTFDVPWEKSPQISSAKPTAVSSGGDRRPDAGEPPGWQRRALAHGRDRRHARRAQRREDARDQGDDDPERERDDDRPRLEEQPAVREREADGVEQPEEPLREREPDEEPDHRGDDAHRQRLDHDRAAHLTPGGAERAQRGELTRPLRDRDRQRVDDHEGADEERHDAEREQEVLQERDELVRLRGVLACLRVTGADLGARAAGSS